MAAKVNVRFVVVLSAVLLAVCAGLAAVYLYITYTSGERAVRQGDAAFAAGDYAKADKHYSRAVAKENYNPEWLRKWEEALTRKVPETNSQFSSDFGMLISVQRNRAIAAGRDVARYREFLDSLHGRQAWEALVKEADTALKKFDEGSVKTGEARQLRRYRGMAYTNIMTVSKDVTKENKALAKEDLEAALAFDPTDADAAGSLMTWYHLESDEARKKNNQELRQTMLAEAARVADALAAADPRDPQAIVLQLSSRIAVALGASDPRLPASEQNRMGREAAAKLKPQLENVMQGVLAADPARVELPTLQRLLVGANLIDPGHGPERVLEVIERVLKQRADDPQLLFARAQLLSRTGRNEEAIADYQKIRDLPRLPVGLAGLRLITMKDNAAFLQSKETLRLVETADAKDPKRAALLDRARAALEDYRKVRAEKSPQMMYLEAKLRVAEGDIRGAQRLLTDFTRSVGAADEEGLEAISILGQIAEQLGSLGEARDRYKEILKESPNELGTKLRLAALESRLRNEKDAVKLYQEVLEIDPANEIAKRELRQLQQIQDGPKPGSDPVEAVLALAEKISRGSEQVMGDEDAAVALLEKSLAPNQHNPKLYYSLFTHHLIGRTDLDAARDTLVRGLEKHPADKTLLAFKQRLDATSSLDAALRMIEEQEADALTKQKARYRTFLMFRRAEEAAAALKKLNEMAAEDPGVLELNFDAAEARRDVPELKRLTEIARAKDIDKNDGLTFVARTQLAEGKLREAADTLRKATQSGVPYAPTWRLMGAVLLETGRPREAIEAFKKALEIAPTDIQSVKACVSALAQLGDNREALAVARAGEIYARRDPEFLNMWLLLESTSGNAGFARERREQLYARDPKNIPNAAGLAMLYLDERQWDKARDVLASARKESDASILVTLHARWNFDQGDPDGARKVFVDYVESMKAKSKTEGLDDAYAAFGRFMLDRGRVGWGMAALDEGQNYQDPKTMQASLLYAETLFRYGRPREALEVYKRVMDAKIADPRHEVRKAVINVYLQLEEFAEARKLIDDAGPAAAEDLGLMVQKAAALAGTGDRKGAREVLDRAVQKNTNNPLPYLRRARLIMTDPAMARDAEEDLNTAISLRPEFWQALRARAGLRMQLKRPEEAMRDMRAAVDTNPGLDELRFELISTYLDQGRDGEALDVAQAGAKLRPTDSRLLTRLGGTFAAREKWARAAALYALLWELSKDRSSAGLYATALMRSDPPRLNEAAAVLGAAGLEVNRSPELLMTRAELKGRQKNTAGAQEDATAALNVAAGDAAALVRWDAQARGVFSDAASRAKFFQALRPPEGAQLWVMLFQGNTLLGTTEGKAEGERLLKEAMESGKDQALLMNVYQVLSTHYYNEKRFAEALEVMQKALTLSPGDIGFNNNVAFVLASDLGKPAEALPFLVKALAGAGTSPTVLDTAAVVYKGLGQLDKARDVLNLALTKVERPADKAMILLRLGKLAMEMKDPRAADRRLSQLRDTVVDDPAWMQQHKQEVDDLRKQIDQTQ